MGEPTGHRGANDDRQVADALRALIRLSRTSMVDDATRRDAIDHLAKAAELLGSDTFEGPFWVTGHSVIEAFTPTIDIQALCPYSPAMGPANPIAPEVDVHVDDNDHIHATVTFTEAYNGPPFDLTHGGVIALIYDDVVGMAAMLGDGGGMTARLIINYRRPTPLFRPIEITAWYDRTDGRKLYAKGEMRCDGELLNDAEGLFVRPDNFPVGTPTP